MKFWDKGIRYLSYFARKEACLARGSRFYSPNCREGVSVLKNSLESFSDPRLRALNPGFVAR